MDFLIHGALKSVLLHGSGALVNVPAPERDAVHKLIVATLRRRDPDGATKSRKDAVEAGLLVEAMEGEQRLGDVGAAWVEAWQRGPKWCLGLTAAGMTRRQPGRVGSGTRRLLA